MTKLSQIHTTLYESKTDNQVLNYWETRQEDILETLRNSDSDLNLVIEIMYHLAKVLNDLEKYSSVYYLYKSAFEPIENKLLPSELLNKLKYELGRGLHHNRKYKYSKKLFNELAATDFDTSRIDSWWDQTAFASTREKIWIRTDILPALGRLSLMAIYILVGIKTGEFVISTTIFIILFEIYEAWWYNYKVMSYLKEFEGNLRIEEVKKSIRKKIMIELGISLLFYPIYFLKQEWLIPLVLVVAIYFQAFHYGLHYYYLPKLGGELNREKVSFHKDETSHD